MTCLNRAPETVTWAEFSRPRDICKTLMLFTNYEVSGGGEFPSYSAQILYIKEISHRRIYGLLVRVFQYLKLPVGLRIAIGKCILNAVEFI
jgi:hypothetical protein